MNLKSITAGPIIDADSHVEEADCVWDHLEPRYAARRPTVVTRPPQPGGFAQNASWLIDGEAFPRPYGRAPSIYGTPVTSEFAGSKKFSIASQTLSPARARIPDMDAMGIDVQVIFPTVFLDMLSLDTNFEAALMRSYNSWLAETCAEVPDRLKWSAVIPVRHALKAPREVRRAKELGASAVHVYGTAGDKLLHDSELDPFWAEAEQLGLPVAMHTGWNLRALHSLMDSIFCATTMGAIPMMLGFFSVVGGGVLDRFPNLKIGFFEAGADWLPYIVPRMERYWQLYSEKQWPGPPKRKASDYFKAGNIYFCVEGDERFLPEVAELLGDDHLLTSADMPREEALDESIQEIAERPDLTDTQKAKILTENPARFFDF